ncbi:hypothetical protein ANCCEY_08458 [Ancylostoma ceylanicum]|uniref:Uncharacterized protein n=1 Tax=Ancylostoma ceylanicum TaxID=53326 RepID=A0A0D6LK54_9BILA|nr:hypothetical protein ANCCEY_08458 [Ancylostoma ceylanicum]
MWSKAIHKLPAWLTEYALKDIQRTSAKQPPLIEIVTPSTNGQTMDDTKAFLEGEEREALQREAEKDTTLTAWFKLNLEHERLQDEGVDH